MKTTLFFPSRHVRRGMTLVELLVVISIMVLLVAVSVPVFKPMLESQRSAGGARTVALALQRARVKAMQEKVAYGVEFVRFTDGDASNAALQLRLQKNAPNFVSFGGDDFRVRVVNGSIQFYRFSGGGWNTDSSIQSTWESKVKGGDTIQFGRQGRSYELDSSTRLASPYNNLDLPQPNVAGAVEFKVIQSPRSALSPPIVLSRGAVVDLEYSGFKNSGETGAKEFGDGTGKVILMFSPAGYVDIAWDGSNNAGDDKTQSFKPHGGLFYFCIGEWDRLRGSDNRVLAEDGRSNIQTPSNFWVTVHPQTGQVRITEMNASGNVEEARQFATEHFVNIGGF